MIKRLALMVGLSVAVAAGSVYLGNIATQQQTIDTLSRILGF